MAFLKKIFDLYVSNFLIERNNKVYYIDTIIPGSYFRNGKVRIHERYKRDPKNKFKHMDPIAFSELLKETTILAEKDFKPLEKTPYRAFFKPIYDKAYFIFMFHITVTSSLVFFKQKITPSLTIYKGNVHSLKSIVLRVTGVLFYFSFYLYYMLGDYKIESMRRSLQMLSRALYDDEAISNFYAVHGFAFNFLFLTLICFHVIYGYMHYFSISKKLSFAAIFKSILILTFSLLFLNYATTLFMFFNPESQPFIGNNFFYSSCVSLARCVMNIFWFFVNLFETTELDLKQYLRQSQAFDLNFAVRKNLETPILLDMEEERIGHEFGWMDTIFFKNLLKEGGC
jgi:hypothetical protein